VDLTDPRQKCQIRRVCTADLFIGGQGGVEIAPSQMDLR